MTFSAIVDIIYHVGNRIVNAGGYSSVVEHRLPKPVMRVRFPLPALHIVVGVAQLVRAPGCGPGGHGFDSHHSPFEEHIFVIH